MEIVRSGIESTKVDHPGASVARVVDETRGRIHVRGTSLARDLATGIIDIKNVDDAGKNDRVAGRLIDVGTDHDMKADETARDVLMDDQ